MVITFENIVGHQHVIKSFEHDETLYFNLKFTSQVNCRVNCDDICGAHCVEHDRKLVNKLVERNQKFAWSPVQKRIL